MILQIDNNKILADLTALNTISNPNNGDCYFITSEECVYSFYNQPRNANPGEWRKDADIAIYQKTSILSEGFTDVTQFYSNVSSFLDDEKIKYNQRIEDGKELSIQMMSELRLNSINLNLPREVNKYIEEKLDLVKLNIDRGWWISAKEEMEVVVVESYLTQDLYDRIMGYITEYIDNNY